jgi:hypothetical protein
MQRIIVLLVIAALGWYGYGKYQARAKSPSHVEVEERASPAPLASSATPGRAAEQTPEPRPESQTASTFKCDGRTYCSQMTSCAEATFFLKNCPGTKMDGDNNGIPCEKQWCR